jgi:hypothetical protein
MTDGGFIAAKETDEVVRDVAAATSVAVGSS